MDPNLFHLDWDRTFEVLAGVVILAFLLERALAVVFENRLILPIVEGRGVKELLSFGVAIWICRHWNFDAVSMIVLQPHVGWQGELITAGVITGGSKASIKLFRDVLGFKSTAYAEYEQLRSKGTPSIEAARAVGRGTAPPAPPKRGRE